MALVPLSLFLFSIIASTQLDRMYMVLGKKVSFTIGTFCALITSIALVFLQKDSRSLIYGIAVLIGIA